MRTFLTLATAFIALCCTVSAGAPTAMNYQGLLTDAGGTPVANGNYSVVFTIYDAATVGNSKWTEPQLVTTTDGLFSVVLGSVIPILDTVFNGDTRYLGIRVLPDVAEISPRTALVSVPYAQRVATVDGASGGNIATKVSIGPGHTFTGDTATIGGGYGHVVSGRYATVGGGREDTTTADYATIGGGRWNSAGDNATVGGGYRNQASGQYSTVGGGNNNIASSFYATVPGGTNCEASNWSSLPPAGPQKLSTRVLSFGQTLRVLCWRRVILNQQATLSS